MKSLLAVLVLVVLSSRLLVLAQEPASNSTSASASAVSGVPRLIRFSGVVKGPEMKPSTVLGITFLLYKDQQGGAPLWMETQNVQPDANGRYSVQLGSTQTTGVPVDLFSSGEARWLGVQVQGQAEQPRVLLLSVPYALKAADAETLGGKPLSAFQLAAQAKNSDSAGSGNSQAAQSATEQPNEIRCTGSTGCNASFIPRFATNGGSATVSNSIISQSGNNISIGGSVSAHAGSFSQNSNSNTLNIANSGNGDVIDVSAAHGVGIRVATSNDAILATSFGAYGGFFVGSLAGTYSENDTDADFSAGAFGVATGATKSTTGVYGSSASPLGYGIHGQDYNASTHVPGHAGAGVWGDSSLFPGVMGTSDDDIGVFGVTSTGVAVVGEAAEGRAISGYNSPTGSPSDLNATMTLTNSSSNPEFVLYAENRDSSAYVRTDNLGDLLATGSITGASKNFKIDHPVDPGNKYLMHTSVESPDMKNIYDGVSVLDGNGEAWIELPTYFEALNRDFRYQLTAIGAPQPNLYVAEKVSENRFRVAGGRSGAEVSWQVTGIRHDKWADAHRSAVEIEKTAAERGRYLHPAVFGAGPEQSVSYNGGVNRLKLPDTGRTRVDGQHLVTPLTKPKAKE